MKFLFVSVFCLFSLFAGAQTSYEFVHAMPPEQFIINTVSSSHYGRYTNPELGFTYLFNAEGIGIVSTIVESISRETIRESSRYSVKNGYIFGVVEGDSLPCVLDGERYYFGMHTTTQLISKSGSNVLKKIDDNTYILNFYTDGTFIPCLLKFRGKKLSVSYFDYPMETTLFDQVQNKTSGEKSGLTVVQLDPTAVEWKQIFTPVFDGAPQVYSR